MTDRAGGRAPTVAQSYHRPRQRAVTDHVGEVVCDRSRLLQVLENLFRNACEHAGEEATVRFGRTDAGFYVEDDGPGIPAEDRDRVFESKYTTATDGTGFGLAIVRRIAEDLGWSVEVREGHDGGARFEVTGVDPVGGGR